MIRTTALIASLVLMAGAALSQTVMAAGDKAHTSRNTLDWAGTYRGVFPCADCEGIETVLQLSRGGQYKAQVRYLGWESQARPRQGTFVWDAAGQVITLSGDASRYRVGENRLTRLAMDGSAITGALAGRYVLQKEADGLTEKYWKLVELNGQPVPSLNREPHMTLRREGSRVTGFGGCNNFAGTYTLNAAVSRIAFKQVAATLRACMTGMETETAFLEVLRRADNYSLSGDRLTLNRARMAPLARFEAVYLR